MILYVIYGIIIRRVIKKLTESFQIDNFSFQGFVRVAQVLVPIGLALSCLSFISACFAFICIRSFITTVLFAALFAFLSCKRIVHRISFFFSFV